MKHWKKWLAALTALAFVLLVLTGRSFAEDEPEPIAIVSEGGVAIEVGKLPEAEILPEPLDTRAVTYTDSGRTSIAKLTMDEIRAKLDAIPTYTTLYSTEPVISGSGYRPAVLTANARNNTLGWINYYRTVAGLGQVSFTSTLNTSASWGALCLAMNDEFTHFPDQPADMSTEDYQKAYYATSHSNLSWSAGYPVARVLAVAVSGQMADEDAGNIQVLGHRRWLLHPNTKTMGVGTAGNVYTSGSWSTDSYYTDIRVFGDDVTTETVSDYTFIAWPASGNNLSDTFPRTTPWSITLNLSKYASPDISKVKVTLTRGSDGVKWTFDQNDYTTDSGKIGENYEYFNVDTNGYAIANCIIFRPAYSDFEEYEGQFTVDVTGIYDRSGNESPLHYKVYFEPYTLPHVHEYQLKSWTWASDYSSATANFVCKGDSSHTLSVDAAITQKTTNATCETAGKTVYTAKATLDGTDYTSNKTVTIPALGHTWGAAAFTWDGYLSASAKRICQRVTSHTETVTCVITGVVTKEPTPTENGIMTYTATATFKDGTTATDSKTREIPYGSWTWTRLAGKNRYDTAAMASKEAYEDHSAKTIIVASGQSFPDALAGSALAGIYECPVLLTNSQKLSNETKEELTRLAAEDCTVLILGGTGTVSEDVENAIRELGMGTDRIAGANREATAKAVYERGKEEGGFQAGGTVIIATGYSFADVLSISPYAYAAKTPILLSKKNGSLSDDTKALIETEGFTKAIIIGGTGSVSQASEDYLRALGTDVLRLEGANRYATSAAIMKWELGLQKEALIQPEAEMTIEGMGVATGTGFPDALGSVSLLGKTYSPLLLVADNSKANREATLANIEELITPYTSDMTKGYIFGGTGTVSSQIENWLNEASMARTAQALLMEESGTVYLLSTLEAYKAGDTYNGETVKMVWTGPEVTEVEEWGIPGWKNEAFSKIVIDRSFSSARPVNLHRWFSGLGKDTLEGLEYLNTSKTTNMAWLFSCATFTSLDLSTFDTSNVTDMDNMFESCQYLEAVDLSGFDTSKVKILGRMFFMCGALKDVDLSGFDTSSLESAGMMFYDCGVVRLDLSGFGGTAFEASRMFDCCSSLETIYCKDSDCEWVFADPEDAYGMFYGCEKLVGVYGDTSISYEEGNTGGEFAKSAKLGGYFTPKKD